MDRQRKRERGLTGKTYYKYREIQTRNKGELEEKTIDRE